MTRDRDDEITRLARRIADRRGSRQKPNLTSPSVPSGGSLHDVEHDGLPLPIGTEGQVVTVVDSGGTLVPKWADPPGLGVGTQYRQWMLTPDPNGGAGFVVMSTGGNPMYTLVDLE